MSLSTVPFVYSKRTAVTRSLVRGWTLAVELPSVKSFNLYNVKSGDVPQRLSHEFHRGFRVKCYPKCEFSRTLRAGGPPREHRPAPSRTSRSGLRRFYPVFLRRFFVFFARCRMPTPLRFKINFKRSRLYIVQYKLLSQPVSGLSEAPALLDRRRPGQPVGLDDVAHLLLERGRVIHGEPLAAAPRAAHVVDRCRWVRVRARVRVRVRGSGLGLGLG